MEILTTLRHRTRLTNLFGTSCHELDFTILEGVNLYNKNFEVSWIVSIGHTLVARCLNLEMRLRLYLEAKNEIILNIMRVFCAQSRG